MKKLRWDFWKSRTQIPVRTKRRVHLGIDYGTSASKIVFRDYGAPGGEVAVVVLRYGSFRIPSRVCVTASELVFGDKWKEREDCDIFESVKMQAAAAVSGKSSYYFGPVKKLPDGFTSVDLAVLTVWFLISEGHRAVAAYLRGDMEGVAIGMTMGVPMAFFKDQKLRSSFLMIARRAWSLYREEGLVGPTLAIDQALRILDQHPSAAVPATPEYEVRDWIRSEGEAAMWWPFQSPAITAGPYAKVDIGAGTTHSSLYRIFGNNLTPKTGIAFFGAVTVPVGMDAVDSAIAACQGLGGDCLALRGLENSILQSDARAREALPLVQGQIYEAYRKAWIETYRKINEYVAELTAWRDHKVFVIGGGSLIPALVESCRLHPGRSVVLDLAVLEQPADLMRTDNKKVTIGELPFVTVAYGLSNIGLSIPEALTPDEVPPMPDRAERRNRLDREDIYAK